LKLHFKRAQKMDVTALLVFVGGFGVCAALVFIVSIFGVKEQTFEEALEAQRRKNEKEKNKAKVKKRDDSKKKNQRWKLKKGERDDRIAEPNVDEVQDEEPQDDVPLMEEIPAPVMEESTPEPSPQPTPEIRNRKEKKKKIEIQEVVEEMIVQEVDVPVAMEPVLEAVEDPEVVEEIAVEPVAIELPKPEPVCAKPEAPKPSPVVSKKAAKKQNQNAAKLGSKDLLSIVEKSVLNDFEAQQIIDVLLNKQSGNFTSEADEWVEQGKPSETTKLTKKIEELQNTLKEEVAKAGSFKDKMSELRRDLNEEKSAKASLTRMIEEINNTRTQETNNFNTKLQQVQYDTTILQTQLNQQMQHSHQLELSQGHYQATIDSLNQQLEIANATAVSASASAANDPNLLSELEQLRVLRDKYEASLTDYAAKNTALQQQLDTKSEEALQMSGDATKLATVQQQLGELTSSQSYLQSEVTRIQSDNDRLCSMAEKEQDKVKQVEADLGEAKEKLAGKEKELARLIDENERLSEQVASAVERPQADGQADDQNGDVNGISEDVPVGKESDLLEKLESLTVEHNKLIAKQKVDMGYEKELRERLESLTSENKELAAQLEADKLLHKSEVSGLQDQLLVTKQEHDQQNLAESLQNEVELLRTKISEYETEMQNNKEAVELLRSKNDELSNGMDSSRKEILARIFPDISTATSLENMEEAAKQQIQAISGSGGGEDLEKMESQVNHYKTILSQTESMLTSLQASVEDEEGQWRKKIEASNKELSELQAENTALKAKNSSLEESMVLVKQAEEVTDDYVHFVKEQKEISEIMQAKLIELQTKLAGEEEEKKALFEQKSLLEEKCDEATKSADDLKEQLSTAQDLVKKVEKLSEELAEEKDQHANIKAVQEDLVVRNTQLSQLLSTGQQALEKETDAVKKLQEQLCKAKDDSD